MCDHLCGVILFRNWMCPRKQVNSFTSMSFNTRLLWTHAQLILKDRLIQNVHDPNSHVFRDVFILYEWVFFSTLLMRITFLKTVQAYMIIYRIHKLGNTFSVVSSQLVGTASIVLVFRNLTTANILTVLWKKRRSVITLSNTSLI